MGTEQMNEYSEQHGYEVGTDRPLGGVLLSLHTVIRSDLKFGDSAIQPLRAECSAKFG